MSFHLLAWFESVTGTGLTDIQPVQDNIMTIQNNHFFPQDDWGLLWAASTAVGAQVDQARLVTPTYRQFSPVQVVPGGELALGGQVVSFAADYRSNPLRVPKLEELQLDMQHDNAGAIPVFGLAAITKDNRPAPVGDTFSMLVTSTTTPTTRVWTSLVSTFADTLPNGTYSVTGLRYTGNANAIAARLIFEDQIARPGTFAENENGSNVQQLNRRGGSGEWGRFNQNRMPIIEVLVNGTTATHQLFLDFVRVS